MVHRAQSRIITVMKALDLSRQFLSLLQTPNIPNHDNMAHILQGVQHWNFYRQYQSILVTNF